MRKLVGLVAAACLAALMLGAPPAQATTSGTTEGCTPGYWKVPQHFDSWQDASPGDAFVDVFGGMTPVGYITSELTMLQALQGGGGPGLDGAREILARAAAAAWLNAAYDDADGHLKFPWRRTAVGEGGRPPLEPTVAAALQSTSRSGMLALASQLDVDNNLGCPLN